MRRTPKGRADVPQYKAGTGRRVRIMTDPSEAEPAVVH